MEIYAYGYTLFNTSVANCAARGIWTEYHGLLPPDGKPVEAMWLNVTVHNCVGGGVYFNGPHDSQWTNVVVFMCGPPGIQHGSTTRGIKQDPVGTLERLAEPDAFVAIGSAAVAALAALLIPGGRTRASLRRGYAARSSVLVRGALKAMSGSPAAWAPA